LFNAFIVDWVADINAPLEKFFEDMGEDEDIEVSVLKFEASKPKAAIIVPLVHPGPFKNVGSSLLPSLMKYEFEKEFGCDACTPLGVLGHERDLASQAQNHRIISQVIASANFKASGDLASPFVRVTEGVASACCQIFGGTVFLCFTLSPKTTEDLPQELGRIVSEEAAKCGLKHAIVVNSHNSLTSIVDTEEHLDALRTAASKCLQKAVTQPTNQFKVGATSVFPKEFSLKAGMGPGGITVVVVQVQEQKTVYVVIDGNNMISGFREKILAALASVGFDESEVFTTDTHAVSAIVTGRQGYHPVGEVMDQELLIRYICDAAKKAEGNLEASNVGCLQMIVPKVRVIGEARLKSMTTFVDKAIQRVKQTLIPVFGLEGLILILLLVFL
jgi:putative membrane protein